MSHQQGHEGVRRRGQESQAADAIRVRRHQVQSDPRHLPEQPRPDEDPVVPAAQQELEQRQADVAVPRAGEREAQPVRRGGRVPRGRIERHVLTPDDGDADDVDDGDQQQLGRNRIAQPIGGPDGSIESGRGGLWNQVALQEARRQRAHALVHDQLGDNQQWHRQQELGVNVHVHEERHGDVPAQHVSCECRERQQRQPGEQRDHDDAPACQHQRIVGEARATQQLEERSAQHQREIRWSPPQVFTDRFRSRSGPISVHGVSPTRDPDDAPPRPCESGMRASARSSGSL